jgi:hypothetical protein
MADKEVAIKINVDADGGAKSLSELKKEFKETQTILSGLTAGSKEYIKTLEKLGGIKDDIGDLNQTIKTFNPEGKVQAFGNVMGGVASGIQGAVGAMALFGVESEETQKMLLKVQAASALADGVKGVVGMGDAFKDLKLVSVKALNAIKVGIGATGIGLLVLALGAVVAYWDDIKSAISGVSSEQENLLEKEKASVKASQDKLSFIDSQSNILKQQGKTEKEILKLKEAESSIAISGLEAQILTQESVKKSQVETAERNKSILQNIIRLVSAPLTLLLSGIDAAGKAFGQDWGLEEKFSGGIAKMLFDPEEVASEADKAIAETKATLNKLKNDRAGFQLAIKAIDTKAAADKKALDEDKAKKETEGYRKAEAEYDIYLKGLKAIKDKADADKKLLEDKAKADEAQGNADALATAEQWLASKSALEEYYNQKTKAGRLQSLKEQFDAELLLVEGDQAAKDLLTAKYNDQVNVIRKENNTISFGEQRAELTLQLDADLLAVGDNEAAKLELKKKYAEETRALNIAEAQVNLEIAQQSNQSMQSLSDLFFSIKMANLEKGSAAELKAAKDQFKVNKALAITNGIISTIQGVINALTADSALPEPYATILRVVSAVSVAAAGAANVAKISATQFNPGATSGGGGATASLSSASGGVALAPPSSGSTQLNADGTIKAAIGNAQPTIKAVVVETDITTSQKRVNTIEERASL